MRSTTPYVATALAEGNDRREIANNVTNSLMQSIMAGMNRLGLYGGLGDSRRLHQDLLDIVEENLRRHHVLPR